MIFWLILLCIITPFAAVIYVGAPYLRTLRSARDNAFTLLDLKKNDLLIDLGSGDGALLLEAAQRGYRAKGYELNPFLCVISYLRTFRYRKQVSIKCTNYWGQPIDSSAKAIFVFSQDQFMAKLKDKLNKETSKGQKVVSFNFKIPDKKIANSIGNTYLYKY